jgi:hypothetical protein
LLYVSCSLFTHEGLSSWSGRKEGKKFNNCLLRLPDTNKHLSHSLHLPSNAQAWTVKQGKMQNLWNSRGRFKSQLLSEFCQVLNSRELSNYMLITNQQI